MYLSMSYSVFQDIAYCVSLINYGHVLGYAVIACMTM